MRCVLIAERLETPEAAIPKLAKAGTVPHVLPAGANDGANAQSQEALKPRDLRLEASRLRGEPPAAELPE
jgi:hypothetical protein